MLQSGQSLSADGRKCVVAKRASAIDTSGRHADGERMIGTQSLFDRFRDVAQLSLGTSRISKSDLGALPKHPRFENRPVILVQQLAPHLLAAGGDVFGRFIFAQTQVQLAQDGIALRNANVMLTGR